MWGFDDSGGDSLKENLQRVSFGNNKYDKLSSLHQKMYSSTLRGTPASLRNGLKVGEETLTRRGSLLSELKPDFSLVRDESPSERYFRDWFSRPADQQSLLIPMLMPSHLALWKLFFLRWVPEACISKGGPITAYHKLSQLVDEIEILQSQLRQYKGPGHGRSPLPSPSGPLSDQRRMYFKASSPPSPPDFLTSSFPFTPMGNLCRRSSYGTPMSKFLNGARIWLSTETLANDTLWRRGALRLTFLSSVQVCVTVKHQYFLLPLSPKMRNGKNNEFGLLISFIIYKLEFTSLMLHWNVR